MLRQVLRCLFKRQLVDTPPFWPPFIILPSCTEDMAGAFALGTALGQECGAVSSKEPGARGHGGPARGFLLRNMQVSGEQASILFKPLLCGAQLFTATHTQVNTLVRADMS